MDLTKMSPKEIRRRIGKGKLDPPASGMCKGHLRANLAIVPKVLAYGFLLFA